MTNVNYVGEETERMPLGKKILIGVISFFIIVAFVIMLIVTTGIFKKPEERERSFNPLAVMAGTAITEGVTLKVEAQGQTRPQIEIDLVPEVGGKVVYVSPNFIEGGIFRKGETLIRVDDRDYQVAVTRAKAQVAQAEQALAREIAEGEIARQDWEELGEGEASPLTLRIPQRQQAEAALQAAKGDLDAANIQLARSRVIAPFSGRVRSKATDIGQFVSPGRTLGRIFSTDIIEVRLPLTDEDLARLTLPLAYSASSRADAPPVELSAVIGGQEQTWNAKIMRTDSTFDTQTRTLFAIAEVVDPYGKGASQNGVPLPPGLFVTAKIEGRDVSDVVVIPRAGLRPEDEVYVVDDEGKAEIRKVSVIDTTDSSAYLSSGVTPGEMIVTSPMERSRVALTLKVLDMNDPTNVLVEPAKPEWLVAQERRKEAEGKEGEGNKGRKPALGDDDRRVVVAAFTKEAAAVTKNMTDEEKNAYRKMSPEEKQKFMRERILAEIEKGNSASDNGSDAALTGTTE